MSSELEDILDRRFARFSELAELQMKFIEVLGMHKLTLAKTELINAIRNDIQTVVRAKRRVVKQLELAFDRLNAIRYRFTQRIGVIKSRGNWLSQIRRGERIGPNQLSRIWAAYDFFESLVPGTTLDRIMDTPIHNDSREARNFVRVKPSGNQPSEEPVPEDLTNVFELLTWIREERVVPKRGKRAYRQVIEALSSFPDVADSEISKLETHLQELEEHTFETWKPVEILKLGPDLKEVAAILETT